MKEGIAGRLLPDHEPWQATSVSNDAAPKSWIPSGSLVTPVAFRARFRNRRVPNSESWAIIGHPETEEDCDISTSVNVSQLDTSVLDVSPSTGFSTSEGGTPALGVPTIMLSNSMVAVPLSLESSQSLASVPLATRRGHKVPPAIAIPNKPKPQQDDAYPGILSPFQSSPSAYSPKFEFSKEGMDISMDLDAMCQDLRSRCPPLRPASPLLKTELGPLADVSSDMDSAFQADLDDWAFAKDLLDKHINGPEAPNVVGESPTKIPQVAQAKDHTPIRTETQEEGDSWSSDPTLTNSPPSVNPVKVDRTMRTASKVVSKVVSSSDLHKQQRRRTVIIETPQANLVENAARITVDLSHLADYDDSISQDVDEIIVSSNFSPTAFNGESTPASRPVSTMKQPVRSILKTREKKSVRFSEMPSMHEFLNEDKDAPGSVFETDDNDGDSRSPVRRRAATTPSYRGRRKSVTESKAKEEDKSRRSSLPRNPAVRTLTRSSTPSPPKGSPSQASPIKISPSKISSPTPLSRTRTARQSLLMPRNVEKSDVSRPRRLTGAPVARLSFSVETPPSKAEKKRQTRDAINRRRSNSCADDENSPRPVSAYKSRMPFRSILTKLGV